MKNINFISLLGYIIGAAGGIAILFSKVKNENLKDLQMRVEILEKEREDYKQLLITEREQSSQQHIQNSKAIAALEKEVDIYKDLQLNSIAETNRQILETLRGSVTTLAAGNKTRARAVRKVKTDLEHSQE